ncbi:nitrile hydratase subunit alpha [Paenibacillus sp. FSL H7-0326]|nr:nitrile hydratase subunit alpha [Paenibacillus sp. FSL H7-0326]
MNAKHVPGHIHRKPPSEVELRTKALEALLIEKGLLASDALDTVVDTYKHKIGPMIGAKVVSKAWVDPEYKKRLLENGTEAISELGIKGLHGECIVVLENTPEIHHVVVCTLCSCYPWAVLGLPPVWYKSTAYRSRMVKDPREVLQEFGLELDNSVEIRVVDSTAEIRYLILPERPAGTENWSEEQLAALITRDSMIGVSKLLA